MLTAMMGADQGRMPGADVQPWGLGPVHARQALFSRGRDSFNTNEPAPSAEKVAMDVPSCTSLPSLTPMTSLFWFVLSSHL